MRTRAVRARDAVAAMVLAASLAGCAMNEPSDTDVSLTGVVRESGTAAAIAGATVTVQNQSATTGADGRYLIEDLSAGSAQVRVTHQGHNTLTATVTLAGETTENLTMTRATNAAFVGNWTGGWVNNTFGTSGSATMSYNVDTVAETFQITMDLNGQVFGLIDPPAQTFNSTYSPTGPTNIAIPTPFGTLNSTFTQAGQITGSITGVSVGGITRMDFTGTATPAAITVNYTVTFNTGATAAGVLTLNKVS